MERIESCLFRYLPDLCEQKIERNEGRFHHFAKRIWKCWFFHWLESNPEEQDGFKVLQTIEQGKSYPFEHDLEGNPIHDVTLAEAMGQAENKAWERFERHHKNDLSKRVERIEAAEDWWNDFLTYLGGYANNGRSTQKIAKYDGKVGLRRWLSVVAYNFLRERRRVDSRYRRRFSLFPDDWVDQLLSPQQCPTFPDQPIVELVRESFASIPDELRSTLLFLYVGRLKVQQVGAICNVDPGTVSRRRKQALSVFRAEMDRRILSLKGKLHSDDLFSEIIDNREKFIDMLLEEFESLCRDRMPNQAPGDESDGDS